MKIKTNCEYLLMGLLFVSVSAGSDLFASGAENFMADPMKISPPETSAADVNNARTREVFCDAWTFDLGNAEGAEKSGYDDARWRTLDLPHDWSIELPFDSKMPGGGSVGYLPGGLGWYRKAFTIPEESKGKKVFVDFDGVYMDSTVWINGQLNGYAVPT